MWRPSCAPSENIIKLHPRTSANYTAVWHCSTRARRTAKASIGEQKSPHKIRPSKPGARKRSSEASYSGGRRRGGETAAAAEEAAVRGSQSVIEVLWFRVKSRIFSLLAILDLDPVKGGIVTTLVCDEKKYTEKGLSHNLTCGIRSVKLSTRMYEYDSLTTIWLVGWQH